MTIYIIKPSQTLGTCHIYLQRKELNIVELRVSDRMLDHLLSLQDLLIRAHKVKKL